MTVKEKYGPAIALMSPKTLAQFWLDLDNTEVLIEVDEYFDLSQLVWNELVSIVGADEASSMVSQFLPAME